MKRFKLILAFAVTLSTMTGCYDLDVYPEDQLSTGTFFKTKDHADQAMMGVYSIMRDNDVYGRQFGFDCLGGVGSGYDPASYQTIARGTYTATDGTVTGKFKKLYEGIARANIVLQNLDNCDMTEEDKAQYRGEAKFLRGLFYFTLLDFWGGVPVYDESTVVAQDFMNMTKPRESADKVREFILSDLTEASEKLPAEWDQINKGRATSGAALALKGKVYLYNKQYAEATTCFEQVINSGKYELYPEYSELFKPGGDESREMIFAIQNIGGIGTDFGMPMAFYMGSRATFGSCWNNVMVSTTLADSYEWNDGRPYDWDEVIPGYTKDDKVKQATWYSKVTKDNSKVTEYTPAKETLLDMYDKRDPRMKETLILPYTEYKGWVSNAPKMTEYVVIGRGGLHEKNGHIRVNGNYEFYLWRKFVPEHDMNGALTNRAHTPINYPLIRLADVYLMLAECYNQREDANQEKAVHYINLVRARESVHMPGLNSGPAYLQATTKDEVFQRIRHERAIELAGEGLSFSDMKRWGLLETLAGPVKGFSGKTYYQRVVTSRDYLWPIPNQEIEINPNLEQNPGWDL